MPSYTFDTTVGPPATPLETPAIAEVQRTELGKALESCLAPLADYCERQEQNEELSTGQFQHVRRISQAIEAVLRYDEQTEQLLSHYRGALAAGQQLALERVPTLEELIAKGLPPAELLAYRERDPAYRLGFLRGYRRGTTELAQPREAALRRYAQHATLPVSATYTPSPLVSRLWKLLPTIPQPTHA